MPISRFLIFQVTFWLVSGMLLFLYSLVYGHWPVALARNIYIPSLGMVSSYLLVFLYKKYQLWDLKADFLKILVLSFIMACAMALVVNPVIYGMFGYKPVDLAFAVNFQDLLYFCLFYVWWGVLFIPYFHKNPATGESDHDGKAEDEQH